MKTIFYRSESFVKLYGPRTASPLTPALSPLRGEGDPHGTPRSLFCHSSFVIRHSTNPPFSFSPFPLCLLLLLLLAPGGPVTPAARAAEDLSATLQRGLFEEEANHDLPAAMKAYETVVNATDGQRKLAGTALFRLAECHRKLGRTNDAVALYQRVLREYPDQTRLADLSRQFVVAAAPTALGSELGTEQVRLLEHEFATQQADFTRLTMLHSLLTNMTRAEARKVLPTAAPDTLLQRLLEDRAQSEVKLSSMTNAFAMNHPEVMALTASLSTLNHQIDERIEGIIAGIAVKVSTEKANLDRVSKALEEARAGAGTPAVSQTARAEQKRLLEEEIKIVEKDLTDLEQQRKAGVVSAGAISAKQRELLALRRQVAGLGDAAAAGSTFQQQLSAIVERASAGMGAPTDEEDKEVRRIQALIKDSPDLINAADQWGSTPLHTAAAKGQLVVARFLLENKANVNARQKENLTPLHNAVVGGHKSMVELLLANGADVDASAIQGTPLHLAASRGYKAIVEVLLANKANPNARDDAGGTPLHSAARQGFKSVVETLLASGSNVDAIKSGKNQFANPGDYSWDNRGYYGTALHMAVQDGNQSLTELLLAHHADANLTNPFGETPLHLAAFANNSALAGLLLAAKADVNARVSKRGNDFGKTPLCYAVTRGYAEMVEFLLKSGADPNLGFGSDSDNAQTPLLAALLWNTLNERERIVATLLEYKADPNVKESRGYSALHVSMFSTFEGNTNLPSLLLKHGANPDARDAQGDTPLTWRSSGKGLKELLLNYKANPNAQNNEGNTALHGLVQWTLPTGTYSQSSQKEIAELLIARGADVNLRNRQGLTPLNLYGVPARPQQPNAVELAEVLRKHGAKDEQLDIVADPESIRVWRKGMSSGRVVFVRDAAGINRFTLIEALLNFYSLRTSPLTVAPQPVVENRIQPSQPIPAPLTPNRPVPGLPGRANVTGPPAYNAGGVMVYGGGPAGAYSAANPYDPLNEFAFPDLTRIRILRLTDAAKNEKKVISVNLINAAGIVLCGNDVLLEFGDIIEIPEREYRLDEGRVGLPSEQSKGLYDCLPKKIEVVVKGESSQIKLVPLANASYLAPVMKLSSVRNVLRSTSDLSRLRITRRADPTAGQSARELTVDLEAFQRSSKQQWDDLWLRDGDVVEVPERE